METLFIPESPSALPESDHRAPLFNRWLAKQITETPILTNQPSLLLPFQRWFKFKEAFSPQFILDCVQSLKKSPQSCLDPFGGSGTTALTCQFLGIRPTTIEVNPFLSDLITSKLTSFNLKALQIDYLNVLEISRTIKVNFSAMLRDSPKTMVEPGHNERWLFSREAGRRILALRTAIDYVANDAHQSILRVALGSILVSLSNVVVNGKGRKYRNGWKNRPKFGRDVDFEFRNSFLQIYTDLSRFSDRPMRQFSLLRGDSRQLICETDPVDMIIFSPPYPNSFDYTDIYNIELWMLGYFKSPVDNTQLRQKTLRSHVQIKRDFSSVNLDSPELRRAYCALNQNLDKLWDKNIPDMINAYFGDMAVIFQHMREKLNPHGRAFLAVGNSKYAGVIIDTPKILKEIAHTFNLRCTSSTPIRSMRSSAQQGGQAELEESVMVFERCA